ncbi:twin-arginine translocase subunit TatC (mitochondrion) [Bryopsis sp. KO-2023]|nr:twin-arginine translocase subunit TatC [Bryopsis sp. KO-2023]
MSTFLYTQCGPISHFEEIKLRGFYVLFAATTTLVISYLLCFELTTLMANPLTFSQANNPATPSGPQVNFIFTDLTEAFATNLKICLIITTYVCFPLALYHCWCFLMPCCYYYERQKITGLCILVLSFIVMSCFFVYFLLLPEILLFFVRFSIQSNFINVQCEPRIYSYVSLISRIFLISGLFFQIPIIFLLLCEWSILRGRSLSQNRRYFIVLCILISSWISPPEISSEVFISCLLIVFFECLFFLIYFVDCTKLVIRRLADPRAACRGRGGQRNRQSMPLIGCVSLGC